MNKKYIEIKQIKWGSVLLLIALSIMIIYIIISAYFREDHTFLMLYSIVIFIGLLCLILVGTDILPRINSWGSKVLIWI